MTISSRAHEIAPPSSSGSTSKTGRNDRLLGYGYMLISTTCFTGMAATSKVIGARATTAEKLLWRSTLSILLGILGCFFNNSSNSTNNNTIIINKKNNNRDGRTGNASKSSSCLPGLPKRPFVLLMRGACGYTALVAYLEAIEALPLAVAVFLGKIHPLAAAVLSWLFLGETLHWTRVLAILTSLVGVALIARPDPQAVTSDSDTQKVIWGVALACLAGILSGAAYCCVRALSSAKEHELWVLLSLPLFSLPFSAWTVFSVDKISLEALARHDFTTWAWFLMMGLSTQGGQVFLARGLALLPAANGTQAMYFGTVSGVLVGVALGDGWPTWQFWIGGSIILASLHFAEVAEQKRRATRLDDGAKTDGSLEEKNDKKSL